MNVTANKKKVRMKTYKVGKGNDAPYFIEKKQYQGACGKVYPIQVIDQIMDETEEKEYDMIFLENEYCSVSLLPEIGGKIYGARSKKDGYEFIYENNVVKPALIGLAGPWVSGGVEFNWPQHHRPTTYMPMEYMVRHHSDGSVTCYMGEAEPFEHMRGMVAVTLFPGSSVVEAKATITNSSDHALPFMWWNNTAVRVHEKYRAIFPPDIEYGVDHDRRAVISFPVMKGIFETARPYDYGNGTDVSWFGNVSVPTSVMIPRGETCLDFLGGYDYLSGAGTAIVADHHISPGKKMFTWGDSEFGKTWCGNLTDNGDRYIELMSGVYTDNQPDFAYIQPGETKEFSTYWYCIRGIEGISNASKEGAIVLEKGLDAGTWKVGAIVTSIRRNLLLRLNSGNTTVYEKRGDLGPEDFWLEQIELPPAVLEEELDLSLVDEEGQTLLSYRPKKKGEKIPPKPREIAPEPIQVDSIEKLYLYGKHLDQYKHGTYCAQDYYEEALRRDEEDYRCNLEMGKKELEKGNTEEAWQYLYKAAKRLTIENTSPEDTEVYYQMGRTLRMQGRKKEAYAYFRAAAWQYAYRSPAYFECACISNTMGNTNQAIQELEEALAVNTKFYAARALLSYLRRDVKKLEDILEEFPQDCTARYALFLLNGRKMEEYVLNRPETVLDAAYLFKKAGLVQEAVTIMETCVKPSLNLMFHLQELTGKVVGEISLSYAMPNRLEDISVLEKNDDWRAQYLLGCLYYARDNYNKAACAWERSLKSNDTYGFTYRNLAFAYYDHLGKKTKALPFMRKAVELMPKQERLIYELMQLEKVENLPIDERLALTRRHREEVQRRDDAYLDTVILQMQAGNYEEAVQMLRQKSFHIYEGGEGKLTKYHRWLYILLAMERAEHMEYEEATQMLEEALIYPENYGEGRGFLEQDANVYYFAGLLEEKKGNIHEAELFYRKQEQEPELTNEILFFAGLCEEKLGHRKKAEEFYHRILEAGQEYADHSERYGYFGVGMETPLPFESDIRRNNLSKAYFLRMLAYKGLKREAESMREKILLKKLEPNHPILNFMEKLGII